MDHDKRLSWTLRQTVRDITARPFTFGLPLFLLGIYAVHQKALFIIIPLVLLLVLLLVLAQRTGKPAYLSILPLLFGFFILGAGRMAYEETAHDLSCALPIESLRRVEGVLQNLPEKGPRTTVLELSLSRCCSDEACLPCQGKADVFLYNAEHGFLPGDVLRIPGKLRRPQDHGNPGEFDYPAYLRQKNVSTTMFLRSDKNVERLGVSPVFGSLRRLERYRQDFSRFLDERFSPFEATMVRALTLGLRRNVDETLYSQFAKAGTAHLLAISGLHLGIVALFLYLFFRLASVGLTPLLVYVSADRLAALFTLPAMWLYALLAGLQVSTFRAAVMVTFLLLGKLLRRRYDSLTALSLAALFLLLLDPDWMYAIGFQLSFVSVASILLGVRPLQQAVQGFLDQHPLSSRVSRHPAGRYWLSILLISLLCFLGTLPFQAHHFHRLAPLGLFTNLVAIPLFTMLILPGFTLGMFLFSVVPDVTASLLGALLWVLHGYVDFQEWVVGYLGAGWFLPRLSFWSSAPFLLSMLFLVAGAKRAAAVLFACFLASLLILAPGRSDTLRLTALSLADGTSCAVETPDGELHLWDVGFQKKKGRSPVQNNLLPFVAEKGFWSIDRLYLSRKNEGTLALAETLLHEIAVRDVVFLTGLPRSEEGRRFTASHEEHLDHAVNERERVREASESHSLDLQQARYGRDRTLLAPALARYCAYGECVLLIFQPHRLPAIWLEREATQWRARTLVTVGPCKQCETLVEKTGASTMVWLMDSFLARTIGKDSERMLKESLRQAGCSVYRTDRDGALEVLLHPDGLKILPRKQQP